MGKLGWTEDEFYTCSPYMFFAACEGFLDKERDDRLVQRKMAQVIWGANGGKPDDFNKFWPLPGDQNDTVKKVWGLTEEDAKQTRELIMKSHKVLK